VTAHQTDFTYTSITVPDDKWRPLIARWQPHHRSRPVSRSIEAGIGLTTGWR
jgi:hypothetical protein